MNAPSDQAAATKPLRVVYLAKATSTDGARFRLEGGIGAVPAGDGGRAVEPWCSLTLSCSSDGRWEVAHYAGSVHPNAWPLLFERVVRETAGSWFEPTKAGLDLLHGSVADGLTDPNRSTSCIRAAMGTEVAGRCPCAFCSAHRARRLWTEGNAS